MIAISKIAFEALRNTDGKISRKPLEWWRRSKPGMYLVHIVSVCRDSNSNIKICIYGNLFYSA